MAWYDDTSEFEGLRAPCSRSERPLPRRVLQPLQSFLAEETASALLLLAAAVVALVWVNSPWGGTYDRFWHTELSIGLGDWRSLGGGDGFYVVLDPNDPDTVYAESQEGYAFRLNLRTGQRRPIRPLQKEGSPGFHFHWNAPLILSPHDSKVVYRITTSRAGRCVTAGAVLSRV